MNDPAGIDTDVRLIQDQDFRVMDDGLSDSNELPISFGQLGNGGFWIFIQTAGMNDFFNPVFSPSPGHSANRGQETEKGSHRHLFINRHAFREIPYTPADLYRLGLDVKAGHPGCTGI